MSTLSPSMLFVESNISDRHSIPLRSNLRESALVEMTRQLMERTIEFIAHPDFEAEGFFETLQSMRPASLDEPPVLERARTGRAFVSGFVQMPLLTQQEEKYLFTRMNYLKSRAERRRKLLNLSRLDQVLVNQITADLEDAQQVRNRIVESNLRLVVALARKLTGSLEQMSDLIGEGMTPLIRSVEKFDVGLGNRLSTYTTWAVRNQMLRSLKRSQQSLGPFLRENGHTLDNLPHKIRASEMSDSESQSWTDAVKPLLATLSERERSIVIARFGLDGQSRSQSFADIARQMELSTERVRQMFLKSLAKLKGRMNREECETLD